MKYIIQPDSFLDCDQQVMQSGQEIVIEEGIITAIEAKGSKFDAAASIQPVHDSSSLLESESQTPQLSSVASPPHTPAQS